MKAVAALELLLGFFDHALGANEVFIPIMDAGSGDLDDRPVDIASGVLSILEPEFF